jgi:hypothetical protein
MSLLFGITSGMQLIPIKRLLGNMCEIIKFSVDFLYNEKQRALRRILAICGTHCNEASLLTIDLHLKMALLIIRDTTMVIYQNYKDYKFFLITILSLFNTGNNQWNCCVNFLYVEKNASVLNMLCDLETYPNPNYVYKSMRNLDFHNESLNKNVDQGSPLRDPAGSGPKVH